MRHYEIVFLVHPDQSEQVPAMVERYQGREQCSRDQSLDRRYPYSIGVHKVCHDQATQHGPQREKKG